MAPKAKSTEPKVVAGLTEGRMVHFVTSAINPRKVEHRAAIVTKVWDPVLGTSNLLVFYNDTMEFTTSVVYSAEKQPGTWHFIEKA